jgi:hypothetical protein
MADAVWQDLRFDLVAFDKKNRAVLAVEVKAMPNAIAMAIDWMNSLESKMRSTGHAIPYWMFVDLDGIIIFSFGDGNQPAEVALHVDSKRALSAYDPEFGQKRIFDYYLLTLVEAWLRDFTFNWKSANPFAMQEFTEIGLADCLEGGSINREVSFADLDPLRGNQLRHESLPGTRLVD